MTTPLPSSFRDPDAYVFRDNGRIRRRIAASGRPNFQMLMTSGLYDALTADGSLTPHELIEDTGEACVIEPLQIPFVSYPYEWSFSMLKDAALLTLHVQTMARQHGMTLKDATAFNVQFLDGKPIFIDTTSFAEYIPDTPWDAYRQFCQHFLAPLLLITYRDHRLLSLFRNYLDGIPLDLASSLLPWRTRWRPSIYLHLHLHAAMQKKHASDGEQETPVARQRPTVKQAQAQAMLDNLKNLIESLSWQPAGTEWGDYYDFTNYSEEGLSAKKDIVCRFLDDVKPSSLWDLGANNGLFTRLAAERAIPSVAFDIDPAAIEKNYLYLKENRLPCLLPLVCDLCNPSPGLGWANAERDSLAQRGPVDAVLALALIHHLAISNNLPLPKIAEFLASIAKDLLIEFVPKTDSKVKILLATRPDIFPEYDFEHFLAAFSQRFAILKQSPIPNSDRIVVHLRRLA